MVAVLRSRDFMPPVRWIRHLIPPPESLGQALRRLRMARGLDQEAVQEALGLGQSSVSNYENDKYPPKRATIRRLNEYFELSPNTLSTILRNYQEWEEAQEPVPEAAIVIGPVEPEFIEFLHASFRLETYDLSDMTEAILLKAEGAPPRTAREDEPAG